MPLTMTPHTKSIFVENLVDLSDWWALGVQRKVGLAVSRNPIERDSAKLKLVSPYLCSLLVDKERTESIAKCLIMNQLKKFCESKKWFGLFSDALLIFVAIFHLDAHFLGLTVWIERDCRRSSTLNDFSALFFFFSIDQRTYSPNFSIDCLGITVDFWTYSGVQEHTGCYVTSAMDLLYKPENLLAMRTADVPKHERYLLWKGDYYSCLIYRTLIVSLFQRPCETNFDWLEKNLKRCRNGCIQCSSWNGVLTEQRKGSRERVITDWLFCQFLVLPFFL